MIDPVTLATNLATASARWRAAGQPMRDADEVRRLYQICFSCDRSAPGVFVDRYCGECGCRVSPEVGEWNKISLATENCPLGKWKMSCCDDGTAGMLAVQFEPAADMTKEDYARQVIGPPAKRSKYFQHSPIAKTAMRILLDEAAAAEHGPMPAEMSGRGIVIGGGGDQYFRCAFAAIAVLRRLGCDLPVEVWYLGEREFTASMRRGAELLENVTLVDATQVGPGARILCGWELKPYAMLWSRFAEVLYMDADNVAGMNVAELFDQAAYVQTGAIFWPDLPNGRVWIPGETWETAGIAEDNRTRPAFESGQVLVDKRRHWHALQVAMHINEYSDLWYEFVYGDKDTFKLAWHKCGEPYAMPRPSLWAAPAIVQFDLHGNTAFYHCCQGKRELVAGEPIACLPPTIRDAAVRAACLLRERTMTFANRTDLEIYSRTRALDLPLPDDVVATRILGSLTMFCNAVDRGYTEHLRTGGFWEAWITLAMLRHVKKGWRCVNVGAHFGYYSLIFASITGEEVVALDPVPSNAALLRRSAEANKLPIRVLDAAGWSEETTRPFYLGAGESNGSLVFPADGPPRTVRCVALDDIVDRADLIFVDAEGAEAEIYAGSARLRKDARLVIEVDTGRAYPDGWLDRVCAEYPLRWINYDGDIEVLPRHELTGFRMLYLSNVD